MSSKYPRRGKREEPAVEHLFGTPVIIEDEAKKRPGKPKVQKQAVNLLIPVHRSVALAR